MKFYIWLALMITAPAASLGEENVLHDTIFLQPPGIKPLSEDLTYYADNIWLLDMGDGHINIHDYNTGLHVVRLEEGGICYVYPTRHRFEDGKATRRAVERGMRVFTDVDVTSFKPLTTDVFIKDTSFLPSQAEEFCDAGYQWAQVTGLLSDDDAQSRSMIVRSGQLRGNFGVCINCPPPSGPPKQ